jgi:hypothetical protein
MIINGNLIKRLSFFVFVFCFCFCLMSCKSEQTKKLNSISISNSQFRYGKQSGFAIEFNEKLNAYYYGNLDSLNFRDNYKAEITSSDWELVESKVLNSLQGLGDTIYRTCQNEDDFFDLVLKFNNGRNIKVEGCYSSASKSIKDICKAILKINGNIHYKISDSQHLFTVEYFTKKTPNINSPIIR